MGMDEMSEATQGGAVFENTGDNSVFITCIDMARRSGINPTHYDEVIIFLGKKIDYYRDKIKYLENRLYNKDIKTNESITTLEGVQSNTTAEIIKALSDNGYNTIVMNCHKDDF